MSGLNGFVKLHRKMIEWGWYSDHVVKDVFLHILMVAAFKPGQYLGHDIKPGQAVIGRKKLAKELGFSEQQVRTALKKLESTGEITLFSTNKFTIVTVENWGFYQGDEFDNNQQSTNNQPTNNQQITNNQPHLKNVKNVNNVNNVKNKAEDDVVEVLKQVEKCSIPIDDHLREVVTRLINDYSAEWVIEAIKAAANHGVKTIAYITRVLERWKAAGGISTDKPQAVSKKYPEYKPENEAQDQLSRPEQDLKVSELKEKIRSAF